MKKALLVISFTLTFWTVGISQTCLPNGIRFENQEQIDNFQVNYPGCTEIEGDVEISGEDIQNLYGLSVLLKLNGDLQISNCNLLTTLSGLDHVTSIGGSLHLYTCDMLTSFTGLDNLISIGEDLVIGGAYWAPNKIKSLEALENLNSVGGIININNCDSLINLDGLDNIDAQSIEELTICFNQILSSCEAQCICNYLADPTGSINIHNNATGCNNPTEVAASCSITLNCLPYGNYYFLSQNEIDNFNTNYPNCNNINGNLSIGGNDITNLNGLNDVLSISGNLMIGNSVGGNNRLKDISGLSNLSNIGGHLEIIYNDSLVSLAGLNNLSSTGGGISISFNDMLTGLSAFSSLNSIGGTLIISLNSSLKSIDGFVNLSSIGGSLRISDCSIDSIIFQNLSDISEDIDISYNENLSKVLGFSNITSINGSFNLTNTKLRNLSAFSSLTTVGDDFLINRNDSITNLVGIENITRIGGDLSINNNYSLNNLTGLNNLDSIGEKLSIEGNEALVSINELSNLVCISGDLIINNNKSLQSLSGLDNLLSDSITNIFITDNDSLSTCEVSSICEYLTNPNGTVNIYNNAPGCNNPPEIAGNCDITLPCLPYGHYYLLNQSDIDNFQFDYPNCTVLAGNVTIKGHEISNLIGLSQITGINSDLLIYNSYSLINLLGLENLDSIGRDLIIFQNWVLESTTGLQSIEYIGRNFKIKNNIELHEVSDLNLLVHIGNDLYLDYNPYLFIISGFTSLDSVNGNLTFKQNHYVRNLSCFNNLSFVGGDLSISGNSVINSLAGLNNLNSIGGELYIGGNDSLTSLSGLNNIEENSIENLIIQYNHSLYDCAVESICAYLISPNGEVSITNNKAGCNSEMQILLECAVGQSENKTLDEGFNIYPNPASGRIAITSNHSLIINQITIYNCIGQIVLSAQDSFETINVSMLSRGMYIIAAQTDDKIFKKKFIIE